MSITDVMREAVNMGACEKTGNVSDWKTLSWLFFSPQGMEFCANNNFPPIELYRQLNVEALAINNIFVDAGHIQRNNDSQVAVIGNTVAEFVFDDPTKVHKVIVMHGAKVKLITRNYAVVKLLNIGDNNVEIRKDKTSVILN